MTEAEKQAENIVEQDEDKVNKLILNLNNIEKDLEIYKKIDPPAYVTHQQEFNKLKKVLDDGILKRNKKIEEEIENNKKAIKENNLKNSKFLRQIIDYTNQDHIEKKILSKVTFNTIQPTSIKKIFDNILIIKKNIETNINLEVKKSEIEHQRNNEIIAKLQFDENLVKKFEEDLKRTIEQTKTDVKSFENQISTQVLKLIQQVSKAKTNIVDFRKNQGSIDLNKEISEVKIITGTLNGMKDPNFKECYKNNYINAILSLEKALIKAFEKIVEQKDNKSIINTKEEQVINKTETDLERLMNQYKQEIEFLNNS